MNDNDIVNALECLCGIETPCKDCVGHRFPYPVCKQQVAKDALYLINRQKANIDRLKKELIEQQLKNNLLYETAKEAKAEAIKEFAERLKQSAFACDVSFGFGREHCEEAVTVLGIDNLVKEMTEETQ